MLVRRRTVLLGAVSVPLVAACGESAGDGAPRITLEKTWQERLVTSDEALPGRARIVGDTVVLADGTGTANARVVCFGAADGARRWTLDGSKPISAPGLGNVWLSVVGPGRFHSPDVIDQPTVRPAAGVLPVPYAAAQKGATTSGIVGVDVRTGEPVWAFATVTSPSTDRTMITAVAESVVLATVSAPYGPQWPDRLPTTIALDAKTGAELWRATGVTGLSADGNSVVVAKRTADSADWLPEVRDARTGTARWTGENALGGPYEHEATIAGFVLLRPGNQRWYELVQLATGDRRKVDGKEASPMLVGSEPPLLAWDSGLAWWAKGPNGFVTQTLPKGSPAKGKHRPDGLEFRAAYGAGPYLWGELRTRQDSDPEDSKLAGTVAVDRTGAPCSSPLTGLVTLADVSQHWLIVGRKGYAEVHRIVPA